MFSFFRYATDSSHARTEVINGGTEADVIPYNFVLTKGFSWLDSDYTDPPMEQLTTM